MSALPRIVYAFVNWHGRWETADSKRYKQLRWVALQFEDLANETSRILAGSRGPEVLAVRDQLAAVAARMPRRGYLADVHGPLPTCELSILTHLPSELITHGLNVLCQPRIAMLTRRDFDTDVEIRTQPENLFVEPSPSVHPAATPLTTSSDPAATPPTEPEPEHDITLHNRTQEGSGSVKFLIQLVSDSASEEDVSIAQHGSEARCAAFQIYQDRMGKVIGAKPMPGTPRAKQWNADVTTLLRWWNQLLWPIDLPDADAPARFREFYGAVNSSVHNLRPGGTRMGYLQPVAVRVGAMRRTQPLREAAR